jgi:hypothetical protein
MSTTHVRNTASAIISIDRHITNQIEIRQCTYNVALRRVHVTTVAVEEQYFIFCVSVALVIKHAKRMCVVYCHAWPVCLYTFSTLSHKRHKICVLVFSASFG